MNLVRGMVGIESGEPVAGPSSYFAGESLISKAEEEVRRNQNWGFYVHN